MGTRDAGSNHPLRVAVHGLVPPPGCSPQPCHTVYARTDYARFQGASRARLVTTFALRSIKYLGAEGRREAHSKLFQETRMKVPHIQETRTLDTPRVLLRTSGTRTLL